MHIQVNTDRNIEGSEELTRAVESVVERAVGRFGDRITRVEVHINDQNSSHKPGEHDKRCVMEARLAGLQPITVGAEGSSVNQALDGAADNLRRTLQRTLERRDDPKGRTSFAGDQT